MHVPYWFWQLLYMGVCLAGIGAVFNLQHYRYSRVRGCHYWLYTMLAFGLAWEMIDAWKFGVPGFPGSRWILVPSIVAVMIWASTLDWIDRKRTR